MPIANPIFAIICSITQKKGKKNHRLFPLLIVPVALIYSRVHLFSQQLLCTHRVKWTYHYNPPTILTNLHISFLLHTGVPYPITQTLNPKPYFHTLLILVLAQQHLDIAFGFLHVTYHTLGSVSTFTKWIIICFKKYFLINFEIIYFSIIYDNIVI